MTADNYYVACGTTYIEALKLYHEEVVSYVHSLDILGIQGQLISTFLYPLVLSNFPANIKLEWFKTHTERSGDITEIISFMASQLETLASKTISRSGVNSFVSRSSGNSLLSKKTEITKTISYSGVDSFRSNKQEVPIKSGKKLDFK